MALVVVLVVVALLSLAGYTFAELMLAEHMAADAHGRALQSRYLAESGVAKIMHLLTLEPDVLRDRGGLFNNPADLQGIPVVDGATPGERGRFTVIAPLFEAGTAASLRFGLEDESARLSLATLLSSSEEPAEQRERLMFLPGMTEEVADSILDWIDADDEIREFGAEAEFYSGLTPAYAPTNAVPATVEELLLVRGVTPSLLYGLDQNRNGFGDPHEAGGVLPEGVESDGSFDRGWAGCLTTYSAERNVGPDGAPRINLNGDDLEALYAELQASEQASIASFVIAYRQNGPYTGSGAVSKSPLPSPNFTKDGAFKFKSVLDLAGAKTSVTIEGEVKVFASPIALEPLTLGPILPDLLDVLTTSAEKVIKGRINVNQAPREVLLTVPGLTEEMVDQIISARHPEPTEELPGSQHPTWLLSQLIVTLDEMKAMLPYLTCGGGVYRAQVVGYFEENGPAVRGEALIDTTSGTPRQLLWREMTHLGRGFNPATLGIGAF
jgi:hypothetical protein